VTEVILYFELDGVTLAKKHTLPVDPVAPGVIRIRNKDTTYAMDVTHVRHGKGKLMAVAVSPYGRSVDFYVGAGWSKIEETIKA
jgi:DMSO/TMAO reductase YedYZ molybdopterin-dependent catalytic subunit